MTVLLRKYREDYTEGKLIFPDDSSIRILERPWLDNKPNVSCIPEGKYLVVRDKKGRHQYYSIPNVKGRSGIEIHLGNKVSHSQGCLLTCLEIDSGKGKSSKAAMDELMKWYGDASFYLEIRKYNSFKDGKWV